MEAEGGRTDSAVAQTLFAEPYRFDFFQAVRLLERLLPERQPVGHVSDDARVAAPSVEVARFRTLVSLIFPPSQLQSLEAPPKQEKDKTAPPLHPLRMDVAFMGLTGPLGVLPHHYTELLIERRRAGDHALHEFLDLFNHRFISFFYRAWEKYRFAVAYERSAGDDPFTGFLLALIGLGTRGLQGRMGLRDEALLAYGGLIAQRPHSASALAAILGDYFELPAKVAQFSGQWLQLDAGGVSRLGRANCALGHNTVLGTRVWDSQSKFRVRLGPMSYTQFIAFLPIGSAYQALMQLTRFVAGAEFDFDVQLTLRAAEVPGTVLTTRARRRPMLGWNTWLRTQPFMQDDEQVILSPERRPQETSEGEP